jgi:DNA-binding transcriptional MerR regulator
MQLMEVGDVARILGVSKDLVRLLVKDGRIVPTATTLRGLRLFAPGDVEALRRERERRPTKPLSAANRRAVRS